MNAGAYGGEIKECIKSSTVLTDSGDRIVLDKEKMEYMKTRLYYPEKFWKTSNAYYCMNKAWVSEKNAQKLEICISQHEKKKKLLKDIFGD